MKSSSSETSGSKRVVALAVMVVVIIGTVTGLIIYGDRVAPLRAPVLEVNDAKVSMRYFLKRAAQSFEAPRVVLEQLVTEEIVKQVAPRPPFSIAVTEEDIDRAIREVARREIISEKSEAAGTSGPVAGSSESAEEPAASGESETPPASETISEGEFKDWYAQKLDQTRFTDAEYRDMVLRNLLQYGVSQYLADRVPTVAEQVKLYIIAVQSEDEAEDIVERLDDGEDFLQLAEELLADDSLVERNFDVGWRTRGSIRPDFAAVAFDQLEVGEYSDPFAVDRRYYAIIKLADRARARQVDEGILRLLRSNAFANWLEQELPYHRVVVHGLNNGYDQETEAWVRWQLQNF